MLNSVYSGAQGSCVLDSFQEFLPAKFSHAQQTYIHPPLIR